MGHVADYTKKALEKTGKTVRKYKREEHYGLIKITYDLVDRPTGAAIGAGIGGAIGLGVAAAALMIAVPVIACFSFLFGCTAIGGIVGAIIGKTTSYCLFFDAATGELLAKDQNDAAEKLNNKGQQLFQDRNYEGALKYYYSALQNCSSGREISQNIKNNKDRAQVELDAIHLKSHGDEVFSQGKYRKAHTIYKKAYDKSQTESEKTKYLSCIDNSKAELDAVQLKELGDNEFNNGRYDEAKDKYQEAYSKSQTASEKIKYQTCIGKTKTELEAIRLKEFGDREFNAGIYDGAEGYYLEAYIKTQITSEKIKYQICIDKAKSELEAISLKESGDREFDAGKYNEAKHTYEEAYNKSQISSEKLKYQICIDNAKIELDAISLKELGDKELSASRYDSAKCNYQKAYNKSRATRQKTVYASCIDNVNDLSTLETLWKEAWEAENDDDRSEEANDIFQRLLNECVTCLKRLPGNQGFKRYKHLVSLKVEGNTLFNEGTDLHEEGGKCLKSAHELKQQLNYELANIRFNQAKDKYAKAQEKYTEAIKKFEEGSINAQRFEPCTYFVQEQLKDTVCAMEVIKQNAMCPRFDLKINIKNNSQSQFDVSEFTKINYNMSTTHQLS